jgi:hypothetical protein
LINPNHLALANFPTEMNSNWQWWDLCKKSKKVCVDSISGVAKIVKNMDNFMKNRQLCSIFETKINKGQLIFSSMDLLTDNENRPAAKQLLYSLIEYMKSDYFKPKKSILVNELKSLMLNTD